MFISTEVIMRWLGLLILVFLAGCMPPAQETPEISVSPAQVTRGETVTVTLKGFSTDGIKVFFANSTVQIVIVDKQKFTLLIPQVAPVGVQDLRVESGDKKPTAGVRILGNIIANELVITLKPNVNRADAIREIEALGFRFVQPFQPLGGKEADNPCSGELGTINVGNKPLGQALAELEKLGIIFQADPHSLGGLDAVNYIGGVGAPAAQSRGRTGKSVTIAILDTGVGHPDLANFMGIQFPNNTRILPGFNFIANNANVTDDFDIPDPNETTSTPLGRERYHGTIAAVLAAGESTSPRLLGGVAPQANILPVKVCDSAGRCPASNVVKGVCYALNQVQDRSKLVLNLSFGGDTPVDVLEAILAYAIKQNVQVAAAGGNQGVNAPKHYPAAFDIPGLVAVAALQQVDRTVPWEPASFSSRGPNQSYLDIAAPGSDISYATLPYNYNGTSFSTPLVAGAMALWREANPSFTPVRIEDGIKRSATVLSFPANQVGAGLLNLSSQP
jgi:subtilisin